jgi:hypothetical protein
LSSKMDRLFLICPLVLRDNIIWGQYSTIKYPAK